ncbi:hypothetical protein RMCBS344292_09005 [Rhizopus microsporus]|nr:hypothetical protein RMCBS344292_09005 [Rhizopus microsporus]
MLEIQQLIADKVLSRARSTKHKSGQFKQTTETSLRMDSAKTLFQNALTEMEDGPGCLCVKREYLPITLLEPNSRSICPGYRRLQTEMASEGPLLTPSMEVDSTGIKETTRRQGKDGDDGNPSLADTALVANDASPMLRRPDHNASQQDLVFNRSETIRAHQKAKMSGSASNFLSRSNKISTHNNYEIQWRKWAEWCVRQVPRVDPTAYNPGIVVEYLVQNKQFSYQHLNGIGSAIASIFRVLHSDKPPLASHERIQQFFQAKKRIDPKLPNYTKEVYNLTSIIDMIKSCGPTKGLRLQEKTVLLLAMVTM